MKPVYKYRNFIGRTILVCIVVWVIIFSTWIYFNQDKMLDSQLVLVQNVQLNLDFQAITPNLPIRKFEYRDFPNMDRLNHLPVYQQNNMQQFLGNGQNYFLGNNAVHNGPLLKTARKETCNRCFQPDFPFISEGKICNNTLNVLILVFTKPGNTERRKALRETWLKDIKNKSAQYIFVIGTDANTTSSSLAFVENSVYNDMLIIGFQDSYANLTYKTIMSFKWTQMRCKSAKYILKVDDDMWLNFDVLLRILKTGAIRFSLGGKCNYGQYPFRDPKNKYYVSYSDYPMSIYPPFCSGTAYVADSDVIKQILTISPNIPFFRLEDIYIALCLRKLRYEITNIPGFHSTKIYPLACLYKSPMVITSHGVSASELRNIYQASCDKDGSMYVPKNPQQLPERMILEQRWPKGKLARKSFKYEQQLLKHNLF